MKAPARAASAILLAVLASTQPYAKDLEDRKWIEVSTDHFRVYSTLSERKTTRLAQNLDLLRAVVPIMTGLKRTDSAIPTEIFVVKNSSDFETFGLDRSYAGYFRSGLRHNTILIRDTPNMDEAGIILHEYAHFLLGNNGAFDYPMWFNEGFAEYLSGSSLSRDKFKVGTPPEHRTNSLVYGNWLRAEKILVGAEYESLNNDQQAMFYAQSWALVHFLLNREEEGFDFGPAMAKYLELVSSGSSEVQAFESTMGLSVKSLTSEIRRYLDKRCCGVFNFEREKLQPDFSPVVRSMSRAEVSLGLGRMAIHYDQPEAASHWFSIAVDEPTTRARAEAGMGKLKLDAGDTEAARQHFETAVSLAPNDADVRIELGQFWLQQAYDASFPSEMETFNNRARREFVAAWKLDDSMPEIFLAYGQTFLLEGQRIEKAIEMFEEAYFLHPSSVEILALLAQTYVAADRAADAVKTARSILALGHGDNRAARLARSIIEQHDDPAPSDATPASTN